MKYTLPAIRLYLFMTVLLGLIYPFAMTEVAQIIFPQQASGNFIVKDKQIVGSRLIAQKFEKVEYFWPRPSAIDFNPLPSGGSNLSQASTTLKNVVEARRAKLKAAHPAETSEPPADLLFTSGSGLDPDISVEAANYQIQRVAKTRNIDSKQLQKLINEQTVNRQLGFLGEPKVNVLNLNLTLDKINEK